MGNPNLSPTFLCIILIALLSAESMVQLVHAKSCSEGYPWVTTSCDKKGNVAGPECWAECLRRHGETAKADCRLGPGYPGGSYAYCECWYPC